MWRLGLAEQYHTVFCTFPLELNSGPEFVTMHIRKSALVPVYLCVYMYICTYISTGVANSNINDSTPAIYSE
jgi:hypothetical protein